MKDKIEIIVDYCYFYRGSTNCYLNIVKQEYEDRYPVYCLISDYGEVMHTSEDWLDICKYCIDLFEGKYA